MLSPPRSCRSTTTWQAREYTRQKQHSHMVIRKEHNIATLCRRYGLHQYFAKVISSSSYHVREHLARPASASSLMAVSPPRSSTSACLARASSQSRAASRLRVLTVAITTISSPSSHRHTDGEMTSQQAAHIPISHPKNNIPMRSIRAGTRARPTRPSRPC